VLAVACVPPVVVGRGTPTADGQTSADLGESAFQGEWLSRELNYAMRVQGMRGIATITNSPTAYRVGDVILHIREMKGRTFRGEQIFTDGRFYAVDAMLLGRDSLRITGFNQTWVMIRR
jgi:hypothetical protein